MASGRDCLDCRVSIHSPRRSEGRQGFNGTNACRTSFNPLPPPKRGETSDFAAMLRAQSTPPAEARGDSGAKVETFQSTPPAEARGDP